MEEPVSTYAPISTYTPVSTYMIDGVLSARPMVQAEAAEAELFEAQQSAKWAKIIAAVIFVIALMLIPTFFVDDDQYQKRSSKVVAQAKGAG